MAAPLPLPALHATHAGIWLAGGGGEVREAARGEAIARAAETPHILLNAPLVGQRLGYPDLSGLDLLELFAFVFPARFAVPTVAGLSRALGPRAAGRAKPRPRRRCGAIAGAHCSTRSPIPTGREREGAWTANATLAPARLGLGAVGRRPGSSGPSAASACCSRGSSNGRKPASAPPPLRGPDRARRSDAPSSTS